MIHLTREAGKLGMQNPPGLNIDFFTFDWEGLASRWASRPPSKNEPMAKALKPSALEGILDVGSGTGQDALYMASVGLRVLSFERDFLVYLLLVDALKRLERHEDRKIRQLAGNISFHYGDVRHLKGNSLKNWGVYFDPMYMSSGGKGERKRHHHALPRKEMQFLRWRESLISGHSTAKDVSEIFHWSCEREASRLVLKRPIKAPDLSADMKERSFRREVIFKGKTTRYEVYKSQLS